MVKVNVSSMNNQSTTVSTASSNRTNSLNTAINSFNDLLNASNLQGSAFTNAKAYSSNVLIPLIQGMLLYTENLGTNTAELSTLYSQYCGNEDLDSADLERQIASYQSSLRAARNAYNLLLTDASATSKAKTSARSTVDGIQSSLQDVQEKLTNLNAFNAASATVFSGMSDLEIALNQGITQVGSDYSSFSKTKSFPEYNSTNLPWVNYINYRLALRDELDSGEVSEITSNETLTNAEYYLKNIQKGYVATHIRELETTAKNGIPQVAYMHGNKYIDTFFGADKYINMNRLQRGKAYSFLSSNGKNVRNGKYAQVFFEASGLLYPEAIIKGHPVNWQAVKSNLKAMTVDKGLAAMKGSMANKLTFGASSLISDVKAIKSAKGVGKAIPGVSLAAGLFEVGVGTVTTDDIAQKNGIQRGSTEYTVSQAAGIGIDAAKVGVDTVVATVGYSVGVTAATVALTALGTVTAAPVLAGAITVGVGIAAGMALSNVISPMTTEAAKGVKEVTTKAIKSVSDGMKNFGKTLGKVFG